MRTFQSTLPIREETSCSPAPSASPENFNPLFPYGKRPNARQRASKRSISIHSSHTGRDCQKGENNSGSAAYFNPLFPYGKRRGLAGGLCREAEHFNPLFPYGKRQIGADGILRYFEFQSTLPIREETAYARPPVPELLISIHSSHTGRDDPQAGGQSGQPISIHSSHTGRDDSFSAERDVGPFQSTLPIREETCRAGRV